MKYLHALRNIIFQCKYSFQSGSFLICLLYILCQCSKNASAIATFEISAISHSSVVIKMIKASNVSRFDMIVDIFDLNLFKHFRQTELTTDRVDQLFLFDGLTPATWFALRIQYRLHHRFSDNPKTDITTKQDLIFKTKDSAGIDNTIINEQIIYLDNIVSTSEQLEVSVKSVFHDSNHIKVVVVPELVLCDRGVIKANALQLNISTSTIISFDLRKINLRQHLPYTNSKNPTYQYHHHHSCSTLCIYPYLKTTIENKDELFRGIAWCSSIEEAQNQILITNSRNKISFFMVGCTYIFYLFFKYLII
uniref:Uncharacterized protein n=2 Tax=Strongyloides stercoralis TaxID=6248 RepID=A0AAF5DQ62_STRER